MSKIIPVGDINAKLRIWDLDGSDQHAELRRAHYATTRAIICCYDCTDADSFFKVRFFMNHAKMANDKSILVLVANKADLD